MRALTIHQPWASLIMAGVKDVENRTWPVPSTLLEWWRCACGALRHYRVPTAAPWCGCAGWESDSPFPFRLGIHAGKGIDYAAFTQHPEIKPLWARPRYPAGVLLGSVLIIDCHLHSDCARHQGGLTPNCCSPWAEPDAYHWTLTNPQPLAEPIPMRGQRGLWTVPDDVAVLA